MGLRSEWPKPGPSKAQRNNDCCGYPFHLLLPVVIYYNPEYLALHDQQLDQECVPCRYLLFQPETLSFHQGHRTLQGNPNAGGFLEPAAAHVLVQTRLPQFQKDHRHSST